MKQLPDPWPFPPVERFAAVDGKKVPTPPQWKSGNGAWGCYRSHLAILEKCLMEGIESYVVFEDDAGFVPDFAEKLLGYIEELPSDWGLAYLGGQHLFVGKNPPQKISERVYPHDDQQPKPDHAQQIGDTQTLYWGLPIALRQLTVNASRWHPIRLPSVKAARCFDDGELDFVFIDAEHSYEAAKADIAAWWPKIRSGGLLIGHDYHRKRFPGVCRAVDEFAGREEANVVTKEHTVWTTAKP